MPNQKILAQGAEAIILLDESKNKILKRRIKKSYRIKEIDKKIRKLRTRSEAKLIEKASKIIPAPKILKSDENLKEIQMEFIRGKKLSEHLDNFLLKEQLKICKEIGKNIAKIHNSNIIHGDLTTSNMILVKNSFTNNKTHKSQSQLQKNLSLKKYKQSALTKSGAKQKNSEPIIYFIDFGLGFSSHKYEDKATDLYLLKQALETKHFERWKKLLDALIKGYKKHSKDFKEINKRLKKIETRRRYKKKS